LKDIAEEIRDFDQFKVLAHPQRLAILRQLMEGSATLSQLAERFGQSAAHIRHHLLVLKDAGLVELVSTQPVRGTLAKYYQATARAYWINFTVLQDASGGRKPLVIASKDDAVRRVADYFQRRLPEVAPVVFPLNSLAGLLALRQGVCQIATCHLIEPDSQRYNRSFVRHFFPGEEMALVQFFHREEGLLVKAGNPLQIRRLDDLARPGLRMINRESGSGVRIWLDQALKGLGLSPGTIAGYDSVAHSHAAVGQAVLQGEADVGIATAVVARQAGLGFIPLFEEPYEAAVSLSCLKDPSYASFFDHLNSAEFRAAIRGVDGYHVLQTAGQVDRVS
jgi:molybdate-binding protein